MATTRRLRARALGTGLAARLGAVPRLSGPPTSVFTRAINFEAADGALVTLHGPGPLAAPFAIALASWGDDLSDADIADLAAYFSAQAGGPGTAKPEHVELGQKLYRAGNARAGLPSCMSCHGPSGAGNGAAGYPALAGQHAEYTAIQLKAFKSEQRANDKDSVMRTIAGKMTIREIEAVSSYIQGLH